MWTSQTRRAFDGVDDFWLPGAGEPADEPTEVPRALFEARRAGQEPGRCPAHAKNSRVFCHCAGPQAE